MFRIGEVQIAHPFLQAAMSGYSDLPMRRIARSFGASLTINQVVLSRNLGHDGEWRNRLLSVPADDHPVAAQIMGSEPGEFAQAAAKLVDAGYDIIDLNLGCPVDKVLKRCRGGFLLSEPRMALAIVSAVMDAVGGRAPVTVKMRRGLDDSARSERNFHAIFDGALERGVAAITIHGRTVKQRYTGMSDWRFVGRVRRRAEGAVVLGSGDLFSARDSLRRLADSGVDGLTLARGSLGNPWLFRDCVAMYGGQPLPPPPSLAEQRHTILRHFEEATSYYGIDDGRKIMRRFMLKYTKLHPRPRAARQAFVHMPEDDAFERVFDAWYNLARTWPAVVRPHL